MVVCFNASTVFICRLLVLCTVVCLQAGRLVHCLACSPGSWYLGLGHAHLYAENQRRRGVRGVDRYQLMRFRTAAHFLAPARLTTNKQCIGPPCSRAKIYAARVSRGGSSYRSISAAGQRPHSAANPPAVAAAVDRWDRRTDGSVREYVFFVFFRFQKHDFLRFFELLHTFSRTLTDGQKDNRPVYDAYVPHSVRTA